MIWEAFKPETEPQRATRQEQVTAKRSDLLDAIRRGFGAVGGHVAPRPDSGGEDMVVEQGGAD